MRPTASLRMTSPCYGYLYCGYLFRGYHGDIDFFDSLTDYIDCPNPTHITIWAKIQESVRIEVRLHYTTKKSKEYTVTFPIDATDIVNKMAFASFVVFYVLFYFLLWTLVRFYNIK